MCFPLSRVRVDKAWPKSSPEMCRDLSCYKSSTLIAWHKNKSHLSQPHVVKGRWFLFILINSKERKLFTKIMFF